ncbi:MAG: hypothetical protein N3G19_02875 [Candidatus Pacearchaeota archaeon]|nr:hypothetical protein [Candidatus Pacearchaeota archaeon]
MKVQINKNNKRKTNWNKKAQLKIQEMAFVLVAVIFLFGILLLFFARFQATSLQKQATELASFRTTTMLRTIASMPELTCAGEANCIDFDKLIVFNNSATIRNRYSELWESSNIVKVIVEEVYPKPIRAVRYIIYEKTTQQNTITYSTFISLCSIAKDKKCKIAKIKVTTIVP